MQPCEDRSVNLYKYEHQIDQFRLRYLLAKKGMLTKVEVSQC